MKKFYYYTPRILSVIITLFWMSFVFLSHGFSITTLMESGVWLTILLVTIFAWQGKTAGKLGLLALGICYIYLTKGRENIITYLIITGPFFLTGILFLLDKSKDNKIFFELLKKFRPAKVKQIKKTEEQDDRRII